MCHTLIWNNSHAAGVVTQEFLHACVETHMNQVLLLVHDGILKTPFRVPLRGNPTSQVCATANHARDGSCICRQHTNKRNWEFYGRVVGRA